MNLRGGSIIPLVTAGTDAKIGKAEEARKILQAAESAWKPGDPLAVFIAGIHARLGEKGAAFFEWLEDHFNSTNLLSHTSRSFRS
jgi:hypothetical protein